MKQNLGIIGLLAFVVLLTSFWTDGLFLQSNNLENVIRRTSLFGIISIGVAFVIITGGIDLSIGSVICLVGCGLPWMLSHGVPLPAAFLAALAACLAIGLWHGFLIAKLKLQPFVVTLCGLLIYRGITRGFAHDETQGFGSEYGGVRKLANGEILEVPLPFNENALQIPIPFLILLAVAALAAVFLNQTIWGRHLLALGRNEEAARYSGIRTDRMVILSYVICSLAAGLGGVLFVMDVNMAQPSDFGNFYELYAIAAAVLGGCSLRGGYGSILGVVVGAALMQVLRNMINLVDVIPTNIEFAVIGAVILGGVVVDESVKQLARKRWRAVQKDTAPSQE